MTSKNENAKALAAVACALAALDIEARSITFSHIHPSVHGESYNHLLFVKQIRNLYFYTNRNDLVRIRSLEGNKFDVLVGTNESQRLFKISIVGLGW